MKEIIIQILSFHFENAQVQILGVFREVTWAWVVPGISDVVCVDRWGGSRDPGRPGSTVTECPPDAHVPPRHLSVWGRDTGSAGSRGN